MRYRSRPNYNLGTKDLKFVGFKVNSLGSIKQRILNVNYNSLAWQDMDIGGVSMNHVESLCCFSALLFLFCLAISEHNIQLNTIHLLLHYLTYICTNEILCFRLLKLLLFDERVCLVPQLSTCVMRLNHEPCWSTFIILGRISHWLGNSFVKAAETKNFQLGIFPLYTWHLVYGTLHKIQHSLYIIVFHV